MMKYEPADRPNNTAEIEWLMMPFADAPPEANWELIDLIASVMSTLSEEDQQALHGIFYERKTYQELAGDLGIRAKSHAWRKTDAALRNLKKALLENDEFMEMFYGI